MRLLVFLLALAPALAQVAAAQDVPPPEEAPEATAAAEPGEAAAPEMLSASPEARALVRELEASPDARPALDALVLVFEADAKARPAQVRALGELADDRLVAPLGYLVRHDRETAVREAAAATLGRFVTPKAEAVAKAVAADDREAVGVRKAAVASLGQQGTASAGDALAVFAQDLDEDGAVRQAAGDALRAHFPELASRLNLREVIAGSSGRAIATVVGAASGAYTLSLVGLLSPNAETGAIVGAFGGLVIGGAAANLLARSADLDEGDAQFIGSAGVWSVPVGFFAGRLLGGRSGDCPKGCTAVMLGTHLATMGGSWLLRDKVAFTALDTLEVNALTLSGLFLSMGAVELPRPSGDLRPGLAVLAALPAVSFAAATFFADDLKLTVPLAGMTLIAALDGLYVGQMLGDGLIPDAREAGARNDDKARQLKGLRWLGLGLGLGGMLAGSTVWKPTSSEVQLIGYAAVLGHALGAGVPRLAQSRAEDDDAAMIASAVTGVALGVTTGLLTRPLGLKLQGGDSLFVPLGLAFSAWQGFGWASQMRDRGTFEGDELGLGLTLAGVGGLATMTLSQFTNMSAWESGWTYSAAVWGGWLMGWSSYATRAHGSTTLAMALAGSAVGLAVGGVLVSPLVGIDPSRLAWTSVFGVAGMTVASMTAVFVAYDPTSDSRAVSTANVVGTAVGLAVGAIVSGWLVEEGVGGDLPSLSGPAPGLPSVAISPIFEPGSTRMEGLGASLTWAL